MVNPNHKGNAAELAIAAEAAMLGLSVLKPLTEHERYDLVLGIDGKLHRVQCKWASHLRIAPARNNQRAALHFAADYELRGAVAQLAERRRGTAEATGSNPVSSTLDRAPSDGVGMDRFYARLAHYVRQAEEGGEVLVTRWGRPVARLVPPTLNPASPGVDV